MMLRTRTSVRFALYRKASEENGMGRTDLDWVPYTDSQGSTVWGAVVQCAEHRHLNGTEETFRHTTLVWDDEGWWLPCFRCGQAAVKLTPDNFRGDTHILEPVIESSPLGA